MGAPTTSNSRRRIYYERWARPTWIVQAKGLLLFAIAAATTTAIGWLVGTVQTPRAALVAVAISLIVYSLTIALAEQSPGLSILVRPPVLVALASASATLAAAFFLSDRSLANVFPLRVAEAVGMIVGMTVWRRTPNKEASSSLVPVVRSEVVMRLWWVSLSAALLFFMWQAVPLLAGNVESSRVDLAVSGSGYLRLVAYMTVPTALAYVALTDVKRSRYILVATACVLLAFANRSPLVYLVVPPVVLLLLTTRSALVKRRLFIATMIGTVLVIGLGVYRITSESQFRHYEEYSADLRDGNYLGIAGTTLSQYLKVVGENGSLTRELVDDGKISTAYGSTYFLLFRTALPGEQLTLDREIRLASSQSFVGGGTPPTLAGEAYVNFGIFGCFLVPFALMGLLNAAYARIRAVEINASTARLMAMRYGFLITWFSGAQVAGIAGASTMPMATFIGLFILTRSEKSA